MNKQQIRQMVRGLNPNRNRKEIDDFCRNNKKYYGIDKDGFCIDQLEVDRVKCFWCTEYVRGNNLCRTNGDVLERHPHSWLDMETRTDRRGPHRCGGKL